VLGGDGRRLLCVGVDQRRHERADGVGIREGTEPQPCRSIAASIPHGVYVLLD
jgi:hypothetical protein